MFVRRNVTVAAVVGALAMSACGAASSGDATPAPGAPAAEATPATNAAEALSPTPTEASVVEEAPAESVAAEPASEPVATEAPATEPPVTDPPATVPPPAEIGGRTFAEALAPTSDIATNPLPDLVVDDIRGASKVNLRNVFPADRPVLIWMWAPH